MSTDCPCICHDTNGGPAHPGQKCTCNGGPVNEWTDPDAYDHLIECGGCGASWISEREESPCACKRGDERYEDWQVTPIESCPDCAGRGRRQLFYSRPLSLPCSRCHGRGWLSLSTQEESKA